MSFADNPVSSQEVHLDNEAHLPKVTRKSLKRSLTFAPDAAANLQSAGVLGIAGSDSSDESMAKFSILRLDLNMGHGSTIQAHAGSLISSLERNSISRLLSSRLESSLSHLKNLEGRVMSTNSRVLVTGDLNAGKSTFVNALLRRGGVDEDGWPTGVLPVDQQPLTGRFVEVFGGTHADDANSEVVHVVKGKEDSYDVTDESTYDVKKLADLTELVAEQEAEAPPLKLYLRAPRLDLKNPSILHNGILDISLIDAPGLNRDVIGTTCNFTRSPTIDVIIFVVSATNHFTLSAKEFILSAGQEKARMFIVVNRYDEVRDKEKCRRTVLDQIRQLSPKTWEERLDLVHFVDSASVALGCSDETEEFKVVDAAFVKLEQALRSFVLVNRAKSKLGPAENYLCHLLADVELLASANTIVAEEAREKAKDEMDKVKPGLDAMLKGSSAMEESLGEEEEKVGGSIDSVVRTRMGEVLRNVGNGKLEKGLPPYPGFLGVWDYAIEVRKALLKGVEVAVMQLEDETRSITSTSIARVSTLGDRHLPSDVKRSDRVFNSQAMFSGRKNVVGLDLVHRSELAPVSMADLFDIHHYILAAKSTLTGQKSITDGASHEGEITILGVASLAAGTMGLFGTKALGLRAALESVVSVSDVLGDKAARKWAGPVAGAAVLGLAYYLVQDLPSTIPRNIGRHIQSVLESGYVAASISEEGTYTDIQSARLQREARKVVRLASWDLRERFRAALEEKNKIVRESEKEEKKAARALQYFGGVVEKVVEIKEGMGESVFA